MKCNYNKTCIHSINGIYCASTEPCPYQEKLEEARELYKKICKESDEEIATLKSWGFTDDEIYQHAWKMIQAIMTKLYIGIQDEN